jgi:hypothetical protein
LANPKLPHHIVLSVLIKRHGDEWVAQALEHDFAAHGSTQHAALDALGRTIVAHLRIAKPKNKLDPLANVPPAPSEYWEAWESAHLKGLDRLIPADAGYPPAYVAQAVMDGPNCVIA